MKKLILLLIFCFSFGKTFPQYREIITAQADGSNDEDGVWKSKGGYNRTKTISYYNINKQKVKEIYQYTAKYEDENNNEISSSMTETITKYNDKNQETEQISYSDPNNQLCKAIRQTQYDKQGRKKRVQSVKNGTIPKQNLDIINYTYLENNLLKTQIDSSLTITNDIQPKSEWYVLTTAYFYDNQDRILEKQYILPQQFDNTQNIEKYTYTKEGNMEKMVRVRENQQYPNWKDTLITIKNERGNLIFYQEYGTQIRYEYDAKDRKIASYSKWQYRNVVENYYFLYDTKGNLVKQNFYYNDRLSGFAHWTEHTTETNFEFDAQNRPLLTSVVGKYQSNHNSISSLRPINYKTTTSYNYQTLTEEEESNENPYFLVYPNPATNDVKITNTLTYDCMKSVKLIKVDGSLIEGFNYVVKNENETISGRCSSIVSFQNVPTGFYFLMIEAGNGDKIAKKIQIVK